MVYGHFWLKPLRGLESWNGEDRASRCPRSLSGKVLLLPLWTIAAIVTLRVTWLKILSDNEGIEVPDPKITLLISFEDTE